MQIDLTQFSSYEAARDQFDWDIPDDYNVARDALKHDANESETALYYKETTDDGVEYDEYTFAELDTWSNRLANGLREIGIEKGDRVGTYLDDRPELLVTYLAAFKLGAIAVPLSELFGPDAVSYRVQNSEMKTLVTDYGGLETLAEIDETLPLESVIGIETTAADYTFEEVLGDSSFTIVDTNGEDSAIIMYTSGTTGDPKGVLHSHTWVPGHMPGWQMVNNLEFGEETLHWNMGSLVWSGSLTGTVFPAWCTQSPIVLWNSEGEFDPVGAFEILDEYDVTNFIGAATPIRMMMDADPDVSEYDIDLDVIVSGGEPVTQDILDWVRGDVGAVVNEGYGATEGTFLAVSCEKWYPKKDAIGRTCPGHKIDIVDGDGTVLGPGEIGNIAVKRPDPVLFESYWNDEDGTEARFVDDWYLTGDMGKKDDESYIYFAGREDDVIITSGYRVGPSEVENALSGHDAVKHAGVIGVPDDTRGKLIKAYIETTTGYSGSEALREELQEFVKDNLAKHEYPREVEFVDEMPIGPNGDVLRRELREIEGIEA